MRYLPLVLLLSGCTAPGSSLDAQGTAANLANVRALAGESDTYTASDLSLPAALKATRAARNAEAVKLAENLAR